MQFPPLIELRDPNRASAECVIVCEHASNHFPDEFGTLGLNAEARKEHVAWDPGALGVAQAMSAALNADLFAGTVSRLIYDCNRPPEAPSAYPERSEVFDIPGNIGLTDEAKARRVEAVYDPFREALAALMERRGQAALVTVHSFTPIYHGRLRACEVGILHDDDSRLADAMLADWPGDALLKASRNEPYGPEDGVTHTLREHGLARGRLNVMIEIRNDLIASPQAQREVGLMLARQVASALSKNEEPTDA